MTDPIPRQEEEPYLTETLISGLGQAALMPISGTERPRSSGSKRPNKEQRLFVKEIVTSLREGRREINPDHQLVDRFTDAHGNPVLGLTQATTSALIRTFGDELGKDPKRVAATIVHGSDPPFAKTEDGVVFLPLGDLVANFNKLIPHDTPRYTFSLILREVTREIDPPPQNRNPKK